MLSCLFNLVDDSGFETQQYTHQFVKTKKQSSLQRLLCNQTERLQRKPLIYIKTLAWHKIDEFPSLFYSVTEPTSANSYPLCAIPHVHRSRLNGISAVLLIITHLTKTKCLAVPLFDTLLLFRRFSQRDSARSLIFYHVRSFGDYRKSSDNPWKRFRVVETDRSIFSSVLR